jgi:hypothetical protein
MIDSMKTKSTSAVHLPYALQKLLWRSDQGKLGVSPYALDHASRHVMPRIIGIAKSHALNQLHHNEVR